MIQVPTPSSGASQMTTYVHMTALSARYDSGTGRRFGQKRSRKAYMDQLRERIERGEYTVDPEAVAAAIIRAHSRASARPRDPRATARPVHRSKRGRST